MSSMNMLSKGQIKRKMKRLRDTLIITMIMNVILFCVIIGMGFSNFAVIFVLFVPIISFLTLCANVYTLLHIHDINKVVK